MMARTLGARDAVKSVALSVVIALAVGGAARAVLVGVGYFAGLAG